MDEKIIIGTLASHSALNILSGAQIEGLKTILFTKPNRTAFYKTFHVANEIVEVSDYKECLESKWNDRGLILIPHGSFIAYLSLEKVLESTVPMFGTRKLLYWEANRRLKNKLLTESGFKVPEEFSSIDEVDGRPVIVKFDGAEGGRGYFIARNANDLKKKVIQKGIDPTKAFYQEFIVGTKIYVQFFQSPLTNELETFGADIRYETDLDSKIRFDDDFGFQIVGNIPITLRESLLMEYYEMGLNFVKTVQKLVAQPMIGPFCLETIIDRNMNIYCFEFSGRIVAGTNVFVPMSPYSYIMHKKEVWMGRRIAMEIIRAINENKLSQIIL